jgi:hypothetical protein
MGLGFLAAHGASAALRVWRVVVGTVESVVYITHRPAAGCVSAQMRC